jgi:hypothetical protein
MPLLVAYERLGDRLEALGAALRELKPRNARILTPSRIRRISPDEGDVESLGFEPLSSSTRAVRRKMTDKANLMRGCIRRRRTSKKLRSATYSRLKLNTVTKSLMQILDT